MKPTFSDTAGAAGLELPVVQAPAPAVPTGHPHPAAPASDLPARPLRHDWMDVAKGICIVAVVTMYTTAHVTQGLGTASWMQYWVDFARPFRMPDFFFISGLLLSRVIDRPWRTYLDKKVVHYLYFFVVWSLLYFAARVPLGHAGAGGTHLGAEFVKVMTWGPFAMLWFIQMLPFYLVLTKLLRRVPWPLVLAAAAVWHLLPIDTHWSQVDRAGERYVFFFGGYALAHAAFGFAGWVARQRLSALAALAAWAVVNGALVFSGWAEAPGVSLVLGFLGALAVMTVAVLLQPLRVAGWLRHCGEQSLSIYLGFFIPMSLLMGTFMFLSHGTAWAKLDAGLLASVLAALSIGIALAAGHGLRRTRLAWLYVRPAWARLRSTEKAARAPVGLASSGT